MAHCAVTAAQPTKVIYYDSECAELVGKFSSFFIDKVRRILDNIASELQQSSPRVFAARPLTGPELSAFQPVTIDEVRKLLASIPRKTSPLDVLPVSLLKDCAEVFAPAITTLANLSLQTGKFPARFKSAQVLPLLKKAGLTLLIGLDLSEAFDTVCHSTLIKYDEECRSAKRSLRSSERAARRTGLLSDSTSPSVLAWRTERRRYFNLVRRRRREFWTARVAADQSQSRRLWRSFD